MQGIVVLPFLLMLLAIAVLPLAAAHWWESNARKALVALGLGLPTAGYVLWQEAEGWHMVSHTLIEYGEFIVLLGALYIITGGIVVRGDVQATPRVNCAFLGLGAVLASLMGTTGASMLLIRPVLQTNAERAFTTHTVIFFIFLVGNIGGCLTPLGDPPLFLGYLRGVPFAWTFSLWPEWLALTVGLLLIYGVWDTLLYARENVRNRLLDATHIEPIRVQGAYNLLFLGVVVAAVAFVPSPWRALLMVGATVGALGLGDAKLRAANQFTYAPILEVAVLFLGIFLTMMPTLALLQQHGSALGVHTAAGFFWATGALSSFLDNAPTYATFFEVARAQTLPADGPAVVAGVQETWLKAISLGAVFMGANTYIGNGPNFMIKAIAESSGVIMPSFVGYMGYSVLILLPCFLVLTFVVF